MLKSLDKNLNKLYKFSGYIAAIFLIFVAVFILIGISSRIFGFYIRGLAEYSGYCMASASFFALATYLANYIQKHLWIVYIGLGFILLVAIQLVIGGLADLDILSINEQFKKYF